MKKCSLFFILLLIALLVASLTDKAKETRDSEKTTAQIMGNSKTPANPLVDKAIVEE